MESYWEAETETEDFGERQFEAELNSKTNWFSQIIAQALKKIEDWQILSETVMETTMQILRMKLRNQSKSYLGKRELFTFPEVLKSPS